MGSAAGELDGSQEVVSCVFEDVGDLPNEGLRIRIFLVMETGAITIMLAGRRQNR